MWIVSVDRDFYPYIKKYSTYDEAKEEYDEQVEKIGLDSCVFIAEVEEWTKTDNYDMEYNPEL